MVPNTKLRPCNNCADDHFGNYCSVNKIYSDQVELMVGVVGLPSHVSNCMDSGIVMIRDTCCFVLSATIALMSVVSVPSEIALTWSKVVECLYRA